MNTKVDVLVIGAGPTGMMMAAEAARYCLSCRIIDKRISYEDESRAVAIQARTLEIFDQLGIAQSFLDQGIKIKAGNLFSQKRRLAHFSFAHLESPFPFVLSLEQAKTERILGDYIASFGIKIERQMEYIHLEQKEEIVNVFVRHMSSGKEEQIEASWVIGCDGAHSEVRKTLHLFFEGRAFADVFSLADVHVHWPFPHDEVIAFLHAKGVLAALPLPDTNRYRLVFQLKRCRDLLKKEKPLPHGKVSDSIVKEPTLEEVERLLQEYAGSDIRVTDPVWMANFHINSRMTNTYRVGRVFLAGDAAHIHSPVGGQGMNTGLQDAFNLAWKLAFVHQKKAPVSLLDTYNIERHGFGKKLLQATQRASFFATLHNPFAIFLRNIAINTLMHIPAFQAFLIRILSQTAFCYPKSSIVVGIKGKRAPNISLFFKGSPIDLYSILRNSKTFYLLLFCGYKNQNLTKIAEYFASTLAIPILIAYGKDSIENYCDPSGDAHQIYQAKFPTICLIRPDGYIGFYSKDINDARLKNYFNHWTIKT